jgi:hypothetical protein
MPTPSRNTFIAGLTEATVDLLRRQWRALNGGAAGGPVTAQVDPETLCLASLAFEGTEPRLWVAMTDCMHEGARLLSIQRLKNLLQHFPDVRDRVPRLAAAILHAAKDARWHSLVDKDAELLKQARLPEKRGRRGPALADPPALLLRLRFFWASKPG